MDEETWYSADEAVQAGLATRVAEGRKGKAAKAKLDLSVFNYAGRSEAPSPFDTKNRKDRATVFDSSKQDQENNRMTPDQLKAIGLAEDATDDQIDARLQELATNQADADTGDEPEGTDEEAEGDESEDEADAEGEQTEEATTEQPAGASNSLDLPDNVVVVDKAQWAEMQNRLTRTESDIAKRQAAEMTAERESILNSAIKEGKFAPAQRRHYENLLKTAPVQAKALINSLARNTVPVDEIGRADDIDGSQEAEIYPTQFLTPQERERIATFRGA
jgi:Mu-like prophage I protein